MDTPPLESEGLLLFCCVPVSNNSFGPPNAPASAPSPSQEQIEGALKKKTEVARRLTQAVMNRTNPHKQVFSKKERKRIRRALEKIILEELTVMEQEKNAGKPTPYIG